MRNQVLLCISFFFYLTKANIFIVTARDWIETQQVSETCYLILVLGSRAGLKSGWWEKLVLFISIVLPWLRVTFPVPRNIRISRGQAQDVESRESNSNSSDTNNGMSAGCFLSDFTDSPCIF